MTNDRINDGSMSISIEEAEAIRIVAMRQAVRAMIATHPNPAAVRQVYDQLVTQMLAVPPLVTNPAMSAFLRQESAALFAPAVRPDTEH
jgi:hypothetical protein